MKNYSLKIAPEALADIQDITDWYNQQKVGFGTKFQKTAISHIGKLGKNPHGYAIRYQKIRCVLVRKFPYLIHFYIDEATKIVEVLAVISTDRNPKVWEKKTNR
jgi:plasmid stabilization system protein ParE